MTRKLFASFPTPAYGRPSLAKAELLVNVACRKFVRQHSMLLLQISNKSKKWILSGTRWQTNWINRASIYTLCQTSKQCSSLRPRVRLSRRNIDFTLSVKHLGLTQLKARTERRT